ncbi:hypothetical protein NE235_28800 [Actinoallomurus spadix]|uniref:Uncharacterized protein n=1 Tax=Actinoallomurus spadix TaxID=79912 RepID=A0ABN0WSH0_9ACTN|nr:hypothetical protein [Actinoallomurus spadix]MCO5990120.1 hypothetical protein [Actinoallomurus spadix]
MGLRDRVGDVRRTASAALDTGAKAARVTGRGAAQVGGTAAAKARDGNDWVLEQLASVPPPVLPLTEEWRLSIGAIIARHPKAPQLIGRLLAPLDRFGAIAVGPAGIGFDGDYVEWERVTEVRTRTVTELACGAIWDFAIDDLRDRLPPVPGRKWAVTKVLQIVMAMSVDLEDRMEDPPEGELPDRVACEIVYRGRIRKEKTVTAGLFSSLALCTMPHIGEALALTAADRGVPVVNAAPHKTLSVNERVATLRKRRAALAATAAELNAADPPADSENDDLVDDRPERSSR